jgi:small subunit ribosomal protein S4e
MDVVEIPEINKAYRVLPDAKKGLIISEITKDEAKFKLCRIENISTLRGGHLQLNLHDGRNILFEIKDPKTKPEIPYKTHGTLKISLPDQEILDYYPNTENNQAIIIRGRNLGQYGKVIKIEKQIGRNASTASIQEESGNHINTAFNYTFIIGKEKPVIDLPVQKNKK